MGIVAMCPNEHRVKVKDHLAGKKGICPVCGSRFRIPRASAAESTPRPGPQPTRPVAELVSLDGDWAASLPRALPLPEPPAAR